jgi:hypothetical protein
VVHPDVACRCATGAEDPTVDPGQSSLDVHEALGVPCRCAPSAVATPGQPDVDEHRHWSVVEWGLAGPTAAVTVEAKKPNA